MFESGHINCIVQDSPTEVSFCSRHHFSFMCLLLCYIEAHYDTEKMTSVSMHLIQLLICRLVKTGKRLSIIFFRWVYQMLNPFCTSAHLKPNWTRSNCRIPHWNMFSFHFLAAPANSSEMLGFEAHLELFLTGNHVV